MSIIVEFQYDYWGDNGRYHEQKLEEYESEQSAITDLKHDAFHSAIDEKVNILRVIGGDEGAAERISVGIVLYVQDTKRKNEIAKLMRDISDRQKWLDDVDNQIRLKTDQNAADARRIVELESEHSKSCVRCEGKREVFYHDCENGWYEPCPVCRHIP